ncbi:MAG: efflux RND transporter periplasmic adaptor subunit [Gemmatimonadaceae bacterium]
MAAMPGMSSAKGGTDDSASAATTTPADVTLTPAQIQHGSVRWEPAVMGTATATATIPGQLVPNGDRTARLGAPASGRVVTVLVSPGDRVAAGQVLVTMASPEAAMVQSEATKARAEVTSHRATALYAKSARDRAERLLALKAIPRQDYERAIADDELARASLAQAEAELTRAVTAAEQLGAVTSASGVVALRATLAGVVLARTAEPGTVVEAGAPLVVVADPRTLWLLVNAPESQTSLFRRGGSLRFAVPAYPGTTFLARVDAIGAGLDPATRTLSVRGVVANADGRLKPEMLATVYVEGTQLRAVTLPDSAVQLLAGKSVVFLAHADGKGGARFTWREVDVMSRGGGRIAVARGVSVGDSVVTAGAFTVKAALQKGSMPKMEM